MVIIKDEYLALINGGYFLKGAGNLTSMITGILEGFVIGAVYGGKYSTAGGSWTGGISNILGIIVAPIAGVIAGAVGGYWGPDQVVKNMGSRMIGILLGGENSNSGGQFN